MAPGKSSKKVVKKKTKAKKKVSKIKATPIKKTAGENAGYFSASFAFLSQIDLLTWSESVTKGVASVYDKALDAEYLRSSIGGGNHRMFDGGHDLGSIWQTVADADPDDTFLQEVTGGMIAWWKDVTTSKGMPFSNWDQESWDEWIGGIADKIPGIDRNDLYDLFSYDVFELLAFALGAASLFFGIKKKDQKEFSKTLGSLGIVSILSANPVLGVIVVFFAAFNFVKNGEKPDAKSMAQGSAAAAFSMFLFSILGLPILLELIIVLIAGVSLKKYVIDNELFHSFIADGLKNINKAGTELASDAYDYLSESLDLASETLTSTVDSVSEWISGKWKRTS